ncbi:Arabinose 5-phosphate isomerase GutQ [Anatilimnocola aggregata]|uniref:Arabinose 5-phosphate isomerase GutQ n=1 Tax=Anatilimnocola aggregata TaxID=2528021 RepID=A0A517YKV9_9BACT|nr:KpsF/GutQ family sugar-phosphate isomerase [Anatilimnocola aggregata]QDU30866.1 Arabinose 5-phosphate isomerase GutQ [Anatilimnocola aggregata]
MSALPAGSYGLLSSMEQLRQGREVIRAEAQTLVALAEHLGEDFCSAVQLLHDCQGSVLVAGMGKAGLVGQKIVATLASTGTRSHFVHPSEAIHGDLGRIHRDDVLLVLSYSGETEEIVRLLPAVGQLGASVVAMTGQPSSTLGKFAAVTLDLGSIREACPLGLAPSASTTAMLALGDALALVLSQMRHFSEEDFARFHPGGSLGRKLAKVEEAMRPLDQCRLARADQTVREALLLQSRPGRRTGAVMVVGDEGQLSGIFTDSDLAKLLEARRESCIDGPIADVMTSSPTTVEVGTRLVVACQLLADRKISELPVVDSAHRPAGLIDITDVWNVPVAAAKVESDRSKILKLHRPVYRDQGDVPAPHAMDSVIPPSSTCNVESCWD